MASGASIAAAYPRSVLASTAGCQPSSVKRFHIDGWLHRCGTVIVDSRRRQVRPLSFEVNTLVSGAGDQAPAACGHWAKPPDALYGKVKAWGFNSVELMVTWANLEPKRPTVNADGTLTHRWDQDYLNVLRQVIEKFHAQGISVILMMLQSRWSPAFRNLTLPNGTVQPCGIGMPPWLYPNGGGIRKMVAAELGFFRNTSTYRGKSVQGLFARAWRQLAARYAANRVVNRAVIGSVLLFEAYDILAQPYPGTSGLRPRDLHLARFYARVGKAVHEANRHLLLIFNDRYDNSTGFAVTSKPRLANAVYSMEFYASNWVPDGLERMQLYEGRGHGWGLPVWIGEFSAFNHTRLNPDIPRDPYWKRHTIALLTWCIKHRIGWSLSGEPDAKLAAILKEYGH